LNDNPYIIEHRAEEYRQRRLQEAAQARLLHSLAPERIWQPVWRPVILTLARGLIAAGRRLEHAAELRSQPACETC
jgi:hypothetical protein